MRIYARTWFLAQAQAEQHVAKHFVAVSTNREAVTAFGIDPANMFEFWDWVGGRYSLWSAIGLSIVLAVGEERFIELLEGAHAMDVHFRQAPLAANMPVILALLGVWYNNFFGADSHAILPYDHYLRSLPAYLQQADMESNGKSVDRDGKPVDYCDRPHRLGRHRHQRPARVLSVAAPGHQDDSGRLHRVASNRPPNCRRTTTSCIANFLAQTEALMRGRTREETGLKGPLEETGSQFVQHKVFDGNHPSNAILLQKLTPHALGMLIALYEHKIFVQGVIWNLNSFDQWGVELGKQLASRILPELHADVAGGQSRRLDQCADQSVIAATSLSHAGRAIDMELIAGDIGGTKSWLAWVAVAPDSAQVSCVSRRCMPAPSLRRPKTCCASSWPMRSTALRAGPSDAGAAGAVACAAGDPDQPRVDARRRGTCRPHWKLREVRFINDFQAAAAGVATLTPADVVALNPQTAEPGGVRAITGAGTGLGLAFMLADASGSYQSFATEGGHIDFAPANAMQARLLERLHAAIRPCVVGTRGFGPRP